MDGLRGNKDAPVPETRPRPLSSLRPGEKVALFYRRSSEMYEVMAELLRGAIERRELCVLESRAPAAQVEKELKALGMELSKHPEIIVLPWSQGRIRDMTQITISDLLHQFSAQARVQGFTGALLIQDVPEELVIQVPLMDTWRNLDQERQKLNITLVSLYDVTSLPPDMLVSSLTFYSTIILQGTLCHNFYYLPQAKNGANDPSRALQQHLNQIRMENAHRMIEEEERCKLLDINEQMQEEMVRRRMTEFALLQAENNTRTMLDAMADLVFMVDRDLRVTQGNQAFISFLGEKGMDTAFEGKTTFELLPGLPPDTRNLYEEIFNFGHTTITEEVLKLKDGRFEAEVRRVPVFRGDVVDRIVVIVRPKSVTEPMRPGMWDFAELLKAEVREPDGPLKGIRERCPHMVLVFDMSGRLYNFNKAACEELGYTREEMAELDSIAPIFESMSRKVKIHPRFNYDGHISMPATVQRKDGSRLEIACYLSYAEQGKSQRIISILIPPPMGPPTDLDPARGDKGSHKG